VSPADTPLAQALTRALELHERELVLMRENRHGEIEECCALKLQAALEAQSLFTPGQEMSSTEAALVERLRDAAILNADVARKMLERCLAKADFLRSLASPSYGSDGKASGPGPGGNGGLFDFKA
jgi:hypothetical protein